ncbi:hypothetical protein [Microvirga tunisiensis]|uniref:hypothetical protein n=1 Tax=Microvirga tunisiensis TaxID=2108360 RepID=UPI003B848BE3
MLFQRHRRSPAPHSEAAARVTNWAEYVASLRRRGSPTVWFSDEALATGQADQPRRPPSSGPG